MHCVIGWRSRFQEDVSTDGDGNSQLMKFGHLFLKQQHGRLMLSIMVV